MGRALTYRQTTRAEWHSAAATVRLLRHRRLAVPDDLRSSRLRFCDGSTSIVFRETVHHTPTANPALLVVEFRLRLLGTNPALHALFRVESWFNTLLFAGFHGFRSKLWLHTPETGVYRGVYEWDGADRAVRYAETLVRVLEPFTQPGTVRYHVVPATRRDDFLHHPLEVRGSDPRSTAWWSLTEPLRLPAGQSVRRDKRA